ncbi:MAG: hypothetical protein HKN03_11370 [Acidimicrobiales bacterium]|nr:hypothetical protein [Acidimicrobiales bacterium]
MLRPVSAGGSRFLVLTGTVIAFFFSAGFFFSQVQVTDSRGSTERTCGSPFDSVADRSGWELWWSSDVDDPDQQVREALLRTSLCPSAINDRLVWTAGFGAAAVVGAMVGRRISPARAQHGPSSVLERRVARIGLATSWAGGILTVAGLVGVILLVADADSTLYLYTNRTVVGLIGLIVLMPTIALFSIGRVLALVSPYLDRSFPEIPDV